MGRQLRGCHGEFRHCAKWNPWAKSNVKLAVMSKPEQGKKRPMSNHWSRRLRTLLPMTTFEFLGHRICLIVGGTWYRFRLPS